MKHTKMKNLIITPAFLSIAFVFCAPKHETMLKGKYEPIWEPLSQYGQAPDRHQIGSGMPDSASGHTDHSGKQNLVV